MTPAPVPTTPGTAVAEEENVAWRRWPCHQCEYQSRRFALVCPECEALPWRVASPSESGPAPGLAGQILRPGTELSTRSQGLFYTRHRFSTPSGFLGVLTRRFSRGADWLGADGKEWRLDGIGLLGRTWILHEGPRAIAAAETQGVWRGTFHLWQADRQFALVRTGISRRSFLMAVEDGPEVLRIQGGLVDPLRKMEVLSEVPLASVVLAGFLACGLRQGDSGGEE